MRDTNVGLGMGCLTSDEKEIERLSKLVKSLRTERDRLDELVRGAMLLLNGDCPLSELNCDDWLRRARAALKLEAPGPVVIDKADAASLAKRLRP